MEEQLKYKMNHGNRGIFLIISNCNFPPGGWGKRNGTEKDAERLASTFQKLGFKVILYVDQRAKDMLAVITKVAQQDHSTSDCIGLAILTHGSQNKQGKDVLIGSDGNSIELEELMEPLKTEKLPNGTRNSLIGKPKLVFIQACRGEKLDHGVVLECAQADSGFVTDGDQPPSEPMEAMRIPMEADFLYHYSTVPGYFAWKSPINGAVFIQRLCDVLESRADGKTDLVSLLIQVNGRVAEEYQSNCLQVNPSMHGKKMMPVIQVQLRKLIFLSPSNQ